MSIPENNAGKVINNIGVLDIRTASEEAIADVKRIGNVGTILHSPETAHLVAKMNIGNIGAMMETDRKPRILNGEVTFTADYFKDIEEPIDLLMNGQLIIEPGLPEIDLNKGLSVMMMNGQVICPDNLVGILQAKTTQFNGSMLTYKQGAKLILGDLTLDDSYLNGLDDATNLMVTGKVKALAPLANDLITQKIAGLKVEQSIICRENNQYALRACLDTAKGSSRIQIIPDEFEVVEDDLVIDDAVLQALPSRKLFCLSDVHIAEDTNADLLDKALETLQTNEFMCPVALKSVMTTKYDPFKTRAFFYEGALWTIESEETLHAAHFDFFTGKTTLLVYGVLQVAPDVEPAVLADRIAHIHNYGVIEANSTQVAALQARTNKNEGAIVTNVASGESDDGGNGIGNATYLKL